MIDLSFSELLIVAIVAVLVIGPKDLPRAMMTVGRWVGKARDMTRHMRVGFDAMVREAEMAELEKRWDEQNARIMREHPDAMAVSDESRSSDSVTDDAAPAAPPVMMPLSAPATPDGLADSAAPPALAGEAKAP